ncbi:hypothetical protein B296_00009592, partial [Ensete ventricosum]
FMCRNAASDNEEVAAKAAAKIADTGAPTMSISLSSTFARTWWKAVEMAPWIIQLLAIDASLLIIFF